MIAFDLPGRQGSEGEAFTRISDSAAWIVAALKAAGIRRAVLVGHSMGTLIAMETALLLRGDDAVAVDRLVLLAPADLMAVKRCAAAADPERPGRRPGDDGTNGPTAFPTAPHCARGPAPMPPMRRRGRAPCRPHRLQRFRQRAARPRRRHRRAGRCGGGARARQDDPGQTEGRALAAAFRHAEVTGLDGVGHMMLHEKP